MDKFSKDQIRLFLEETIKEAEIALKEGNYPIGSVIVNSQSKIVASCHNENLTKDDISAHAEILCLRKLGIKKLSKDIKEDYYLFTSLEPCGGCGFFIARTNIKVIYMTSIDPYKPGVTELKKTTFEVSTSEPSTGWQKSPIYCAKTVRCNPQLC